MAFTAGRYWNEHRREHDASAPWIDGRDLALNARAYGWRTRFRVRRECCYVVSEYELRGPDTSTSEAA